jgi:DNA-directed RNA polymerase specialized sigma24 family protein
MASGGSVTHWIGQLKAGDQAAAQKLWEKYFDRLVRFARRRLARLPRRAADDEDVALTAFDSFCRAAEQGQFPKLIERDDLWQILLTLTERKAVDLMRWERRQKRGAGALRGEADLPGPDTSSQPETVIEQVPAPEPTPEQAAQVAEECQRLLDRLGDDRLRAVAVWRMEGYSNEEIAGKLGCVPRTVERKLRAIRTLWTAEVVG